MGKRRSGQQGHPDGKESRLQERGSGIGLRALARVIHTYPTQAEAIKMAADAYNRTRLTPILKSLTRRWLAW